MPEERLTKNDKREQAREASRIAREKQKRAEQRRRWLIPGGVTLAIVAIAAVVFLVVSSSAPAPQTAAGPKNMISDGILLTGSGGKMVATPTAAIKAKGTPTATKYASDGVAHIVTYVDLSCPACKSFEAANADAIQSMVADGKATLEVHPIAILDRNSLGARYSSRAGNVAACVANFDPDNFYAVLTAMYTGQATEGTTGLTNAQMIKIVHEAGVTDSKVDACINGESFKSWEAAATARATTGPLPNTTVSSVSGTPTVLVNGQQYSSGDFTAFVQQVLAG